MQNKKSKHTEPIRKREEISKNPDHKIDEDFKGYPDGTAKDETIRPGTKQEKKTADIDHKDGEKKFGKHTKKTAVIDEQESDGSAQAFEDK